MIILLVLQIMKLSDDLEKLLCSFQDLMEESRVLVTENEKNKTLLKEKEAELVISQQVSQNGLKSRVISPFFLNFKL